MNPAAKWTTVAILAAIAAAYFGVLLWRAASFARVLLNRGYANRGFTEAGLTFRLRALGLVGLVLSLAGLVLSIERIFG